LQLPGVALGVHWHTMRTTARQGARHVAAVAGLQRRLRACEAERKRLTAALQRECELRVKCEARFARVFEATPNLMTISTLEDGQVLVASNRVMETFGYTREEIIGRTSRELGLYVDYSDRKAYLRKLRTDGRVSGIEVPIRRRDGEIRHGLFFAEIIDLDGKRVLLSTLTDITDRKRDEEQLRRNAQIMEQIHDAVIVTDMRGWITGWNKGATHTFGYTTKEALGQPIGMLYMPGQKAFLQKKVIAPLVKKGEHRLEVAVLHRDGSTVWLDMSLSLLHDAKGAACAMIGYSKDITLRKQAEEALQKVHAELEHKVRERTARLRALTAQLTRAEDCERQRLALILHDDLQQTVAGARLTLNGLKKELPADARTQLVNQIDACLGSSIQLMRTLSHDLHPPELESAGLGAALR
jgi:PAS domain S-box-containing protein